MIVCMSRRIAVDLSNSIIELRPESASVCDKLVPRTGGGGWWVVKMVLAGSAEDGPLAATHSQQGANLRGPGHSLRYDPELTHSYGRRSVNHAVLRCVTSNGNTHRRTPSLDVSIALAAGKFLALRLRVSHRSTRADDPSPRTNLFGLHAFIRF